MKELRFVAHIIVCHFVTAAANKRKLFFLLVIFQLHSNNLLDSYSAPPADTYAPGFFRRPPVGLTPPNNFPYIQSHSHTHGLGIQHGSISGNLKQYPSQVHLSPPRQPIRFRAPVPQGLIESIGQNVLHQDTFGVKPNHQSPVYLPPPSNEIPPPPQGKYY